MLEQKQLVVLLLRVAVAASAASILARFNPFQLTLMREERTVIQRLRLALGLAVVFGAGVATRVLNPNYQAVDLGLEGSFLAGLLGGYFSGLVAGALISIPAMFKGELMTLLLFAAVGVLAGLVRDIAPDKEEIWRFSLYFDLSISRLIHLRQNLRRTAFQLLMLATIIFAELLRHTISRVFAAYGGVFSLSALWSPLGPGTVIAIYTSTAFAIILPLKIWNNMRNEKKLETQQLRLNEARLAALTRQINPHFLFNTLNSVSSLIRTDPDQARSVVYKLSSILRRLLRKTGNLTTLREELAFIDNYMSIELVRFGDKLRYITEIDATTLDCMVPSMLLQPIIENSIRHGLSSKVDRGMIRVTSQVSENRLHVVIEDDGIGMSESTLETLFERGIGVSNVNERLKVLYGEEYRMWVDSKPGEGTRTGIELPATQTNLTAKALSTAS